MIYRLADVTHYYNQKKVLFIDELSIDRGKVVGLLGPNGSGKSTLLKILAFVETPTSGKVLYKEKPAFPFSRRIRSRVVLMTQHPFLLKRTVYQNILYGLKLLKKSSDNEAKVRQALLDVGLDPEDFGKRKWNELSGGEAQRVSLAARLALDPEVLLLDEPTANVDVASGRLIQEAALKSKREKNTTIVVASHDQKWISEVCDTTVQLFKGQMIREGMDNMIFGPWEKMENGMVGKKLDDGQILYCKKPPDGSAVAFLSSDVLEIGKQEKSASVSPFYLRGTLKTLTRSKQTSDIFGTVTVGTLHLTVRMSLHECKKSLLFPGEHVTLAYDPGYVEWRD